MQECESVIYIVQFVQVREKDAIIEEVRSKGEGRPVSLGGRFVVQFLATLAALSRSIWKKRLN